MAGVCSSGCYLAAWRQDEGRWLPVGASASGSVLVSGWRRASVLVKEHAARNLWDTGRAEPGRCSQTPDSERDTAEPLEHVLGHHSVELHGMTEDEMVGWHHQLNGHGFGWTLGVGDGQGCLVCCSSWGHKESDTTATELN